MIRGAAIEVRRPSMFGEFIMLIVYGPILTVILEGIEGKLFPAHGAPGDFCAHGISLLTSNASQAARPAHV